MKYLLLIYTDERILNHSPEGKYCEKAVDLANELNEAGQYIAAAPLQPTSTAASVRVRDGKRLVTDGPFAETREQLGGYFLIQAKDIDEAIEIAGRIPSAQVGTIEVRPVRELSGLPTL